MFATFTTRPQQIQAIKVTNDNIDALADQYGAGISRTHDTPGLHIRTGDSRCVLSVYVGSYLVRHDDGHLDAIPADTFDAQFMPAQDA